MPPLSAAPGLAPSPATLTRAGSPASLGDHDDDQLVHENLAGGRREADGRAGAAEPSSWRLSPPLSRRSPARCCSPRHGGAGSGRPRRRGRTIIIAAVAAAVEQRRAAAAGQSRATGARHCPAAQAPQRRRRGVGKAWPPTNPPDTATGRPPTGPPPRRTISVGVSPGSRPEGRSPRDLGRRSLPSASLRVRERRPSPHRPRPPQPGRLRGAGDAPAATVT
ncbi:hypothetical protein J2Y49_006313 [Azospirillum sp. BE72]|nr:hypothetical protein [Azospirillum sp. BE72]